MFQHDTKQYGMRNNLRVVFFFSFLSLLSSEWSVNDTNFPPLIFYTLVLEPCVLPKAPKHNVCISCSVTEQTLDRKYWGVCFRHISQWPGWPEVLLDDKQCVFVRSAFLSHIASSPLRVLSHGDIGVIKDKEDLQLVSFFCGL